MVELSIELGSVLLLAFGLKGLAKIRTARSANGLAALALGYFAASRVRENYERTVLRNFVIAALVGGCLLSEWGAALFFGLIPSPVVAWSLRMTWPDCSPPRE